MVISDELSVISEQCIELFVAYLLHFDYPVHTYSRGQIRVIRTHIDPNPFQPITHSSRGFEALRGTGVISLRGAAAEAPTEVSASVPA